MKHSVLFLLCLSLAGAPLSANADSFSVDIEGKIQTKVKWKKLFAQMFMWNTSKLGKGAGNTPEQIRHRQQRSLYYIDETKFGADANFNDAYEWISDLSVHKTANDMHLARESAMSNQSFLTRSLYEAKRIQAALQGQTVNWADSGAGDLITMMEKNAGTSVDPASSYFVETDEGLAVQEALKDFLFIMIPGFGSHTGKEYGYAEIVEEANRRCDRKLKRPEIPQTQDGIFQTVADFQADQKCGTTAELVGFDIVHPMGTELGNSMGNNEDVANLLARWIYQLPEYYKDKKIIILGYSKGAPVIHQLVSQVRNISDSWIQRADAHDNLKLVYGKPNYAVADDSKEIGKQIHARITYLITAGGVVQGAIPADDGLKSAIEAITGVATPVQLAKYLQASGKKAFEMFGPMLASGSQLFSNILNSPMFDSAAKVLFSLTGFDMQFELQKARQSFANLDYIGVMAGIVDMSSINRVEWNMEHLNNENFAGKTIFNISILANIKDFLNPGLTDKFGPVDPPLIVPQFYKSEAKGRIAIDWRKFSLDNVFLHATSIGGFQKSVGGLFDTQVAWLDTKSMALDRRPLSDSISQEEAEKLGYDIMTPRNQLIAAQTDKVNFVDLGTLRGTHWDLSFRQFYRPDERIAKFEEIYTHAFPRKAFLTALLETLAVYDTVAQAGR